jgi:hypothetical protein
MIARDDFLDQIVTPSSIAWRFLLYPLGASVFLALACMPPCGLAQPFQLPPTGTEEFLELLTPFVPDDL